MSERAAAVSAVLDSLRKLATTKTRDGLARFAIPADKALGVAVGDLRNLAKTLGKNHHLAADLWATDIYDARMLACFVESPTEVTPAQMDQWARDFDSWAICDTACFTLFDRTPHAWKKIGPWSRKQPEFVKRGAYALIAGLALHDKKAADDQFIECLPLIERESTDGRNFVKKAVSWALRSLGHRNALLHSAAMELAERLSASTESAPRWVGKDVLRDLTRPQVARKLEKKATRPKRNGL